MKKQLLCLLLTALTGLFFLSAGTLIAADDDNEFPEEIMIDNEGYRQDRKGPVNFSHLSHAEDYDAACTDCHHDYVDGKNLWEEGDDVETCTECHDPLESDGKIKKLMLAYHGLCIGCHKKLVKEGVTEDAPYKKCYECHEKKN